MRHGRYWLAIILALISGVLVGLWLLLAAPSWACSGDSGCEDTWQDWCGAFYGVIAFGPSLMAVGVWLRNWRRHARKGPIVG